MFSNPIPRIFPCDSTMPAVFPDVKWPGRLVDKRRGPLRACRRESETQNGYHEEVLDEYELDQAEAANMPAL
jgi:hypothetical protein